MLHTILNESNNINAANNCSVTKLIKLESLQSSTLVDNDTNSFIENIEHNLRTPLACIIGIADVLDSRETDPLKKEFLESIASCAKDLNNYCENILEFARIEAGATSISHNKFDLRNVVNKIIVFEQLQFAAKELQLEFCYNNMVPTILVGDEYRLHRILSNLINNAFKFTNTGKILIKVLIEKYLSEEEVLIRFDVEDTGIGIPLEQQEIIYKGFTRLTPSNTGLYKGLGLGLYVVKKFLTEINGDIKLVSQVNRGSTFSCTIPLLLNKPL